MSDAPWAQRRKAGTGVSFRHGLPVLLFLLMAVLIACPAEPGPNQCANGPCGGPVADDTAATPRLLIEPTFGLTFTCVTLGCEEVQSFWPENQGGGELSIAAVQMTPESSDEFTLFRGNIDDKTDMPSAISPIRLAPDERVEFHILYRPRDEVPDEGLLWVDWFYEDEPSRSAKQARVEFPIRTRVQGSPAATLTTTDLDFGFVPVGDSQVGYLEVRNDSGGDAILALTSPVLRGVGQVAFTFAADETTLLINPGDTGTIPIRFTPPTAAAFEAELMMMTNDPTRSQVRFGVQGTALSGPALHIVSPVDGELDFGEVRVDGNAQKAIILQNRGGAPLEITATWDTLDDGTFSTNAPIDVPWLSLAPLEERQIAVFAAPPRAGEYVGQLQFSTNEDTLATRGVSLRVSGIRPQLALSETTLQFGQVVQGWTVPSRTIHIENNGSGVLRVEPISWETEPLRLSLVDPPTLPTDLYPTDEPLQVRIAIDTTSEGPASGVLRVRSDAVEVTDASIVVSGEIVSCNDLCTVDNGTPSCATQTCTIDDCAPGFHDADGAYENGCECHEDISPDTFAYSDVGNDCSFGENLGVISDECGDVQYREPIIRAGTLHDENDQDLFYFRAVDRQTANCDVWRDSFRLRVRLVQSAPGVVFRVQSRPTMRAYDPPVCELTPGQWQADRSTPWVEDGDAGNDSREVVVQVRRLPDAPQMCLPYTLEIHASDESL